MSEMDRATLLLRADAASVHFPDFVTTGLIDVPALAVIGLQEPPRIDWAAGECQALIDAAVTLAAVRGRMAAAALALPAMMGAARELVEQRMPGTWPADPVFDDLTTPMCWGARWLRNWVAASSSSTDDRRRTNRALLRLVRAGDDRITARLSGEVSDPEMILSALHAVGRAMAGIGPLCLINVPVIRLTAEVNVPPGSAGPAWARNSGEPALRPGKLGRKKSLGTERVLPKGYGIRG